jgi:UDP-N-acetylmuramoylalanine--D-glutamate ligase
VWASGVPRERLRDLAAAVRAATANSRPGDVVLLAPACASFDAFRDFEERGERFKALVEELAAQA